MDADIPLGGLSSSLHELPVRRGFKPVVAFAWLGSFFVLLFAYLIVRWVTSGNFRPTPAGDVPIHTIVAARVWEGATLIGVPILIYKMVIKPYRRDGELSLNGVMVLASFSLWWMDTICNAMAPFNTLSAAFINFGSWDNFIPGWTTPNGNLVVEPILGPSGALYFWVVLALAMLGSKVVRLVEMCWRQGLFIQLVTCGIVIGVVVALGEMISLPLGLWSYEGAHRSVSVFAGEYYQYPLYEGLLVGLVGTAWTSIYYFRNDKGQTFVERGLERLGDLSSPKRQALRVLAMAGVLNVTYLLMWQLPMAHLATTGDPWPESVQHMQHLTNTLCGPGTDYACPGPDIPLNRPHSAHVAPEGDVIFPEAFTADGVGRDNG